MTEITSRYFEFGEFQLDAHRRVLTKSGAGVHLTPRAFDLLRVMVENAGRVLEHDELLEMVWPGTFVEQGNLKKTVSALRRALGETAEANEFITTVPRRGYRFASAVKSLPDDAVIIRETRGEILIEEEIDDQVETLPAAGVSTRRPGTGGLILIGSIVLVTLVAGAFAARALLDAPQRLSAGSIEIKRLTSEGDIAGGAISADGNFLVYAMRHGGQRSLWVRQVSTGSAINIIPTSKLFFWNPTFTPNADHVYYSQFADATSGQNGLYRIPTLGGTPERISEDLLLGAKFAPDGKRLVAYRTVVIDGSERHELSILNADGSDRRVITMLPEHCLFRGVAWSPDGAKLAYGVKRQTQTEKATHYIGELSLDGGATRELLPEQEKVLYVDDYLPDGKSLLLRQREPGSESFQVWQFFPPTGAISRVTNDEYSYSALTPARDGKTIGAFRNFSLNSIWTSPADGGEAREVATGTNSAFSADWTRDGRIVFATTERGREYVGIMNADGTQKRMLTTGTDGIRLDPRLTGDGKQIIYISDADGSRQVWRMEPDGSNRTRLTAGKGVGDAKLLSDGKTVVYTGYLPGLWTLFKHNGGTDDVQLTTTAVNDWDVSPDEKYLAFYTALPPDGKRVIEVRSLDNLELIKTLNIEDISNLRWTPDGSALSYLRITDGRYEIAKVGLDGGIPSVLYGVTGENITNFSWSPDGRTLALVRGRPNNEAVLIKVGGDE